ncbi:hypothetical protein PIIN_11018 [Serendipita indica DSM 11827]|uniref:Uncharacterized protein n=1 Tax=Serendipita indica (strain DSM 11827) TaxID=1109443 RepID=G4U0E0_SERID|nr:hypothetical protein PIIN_11018 [Serendipita indica DSM 11827]
MASCKDTLKGRQSLINNTHLVDSSQLYHHPRLSYIPLPSTNTFSTRVIVVDCSLTRRPSEDRQGARQTTPSRQHEFKETDPRYSIQSYTTAPAASTHPYRMLSFWTDDARAAST